MNINNMKRKTRINDKSLPSYNNVATITISHTVNEITVLEIENREAGNWESHVILPRIKDDSSRSYLLSVRTKLYKEWRETRADDTMFNYFSIDRCIENEAYSLYGMVQSPGAEFYRVTNHYNHFLTHDKTRNIDTLIARINTLLTGYYKH